MRTSKLSLCMIVKNEENCIAQCLKSVKNVVDEIIIVDTGSTDKTIEICRSFQAKTFKFEWNGSFADARNHAVQQASGDWILWLDADEELDRDDQHQLLEEKPFEDYDAINIHLINYYGNYADKNHSTNIAHTRLFRNNGIKFINKMHERLVLDQILKERIGELPVKVHHYGYLDEFVKNKEKSKRNMLMLEQQIKDGENVHFAHYYIALEHYNHKQYPQALQRVNLSILSFLLEDFLPPSMVYKLKYSTLITMGRLQEASQGIDKVINLYPDFVDLHFYKGVILYYLKDYEEAMKCFHHCLELGEENMDYLVLKGVGSFQAWYYISLCQKELKKREDSIISIMNALLIAPTYEQGRELLCIYLKDEEDTPEVVAENFKGKDLSKLEKIIQDLK
ncbi:glycosyltransferase [Halobacillus yeomjeoni]|uniref:glycosyltransferase family 2 protein n=1 Tax=Halobacillus yeomjeoni TaxID=311194 RepID=UPI001CD4371A|nr:glycosyltransferase family 2 protein [Halobacillus yeomjeoni]MCA0983773.1 glycosyltransferase [Halobacillus yeomjeoni]